MNKIYVLLRRSNIVVFMNYENIRKCDQDFGEFLRMIGMF